MEAEESRMGDEDFKAQLEKAAELELGDHCYPFMRGAHFTVEQIASWLDGQEDMDWSGRWVTPQDWAYKIRKRFGQGGSEG